MLIWLRRILGGVFGLEAIGFLPLFPLAAYALHGYPNRGAHLSTLGFLSVCAAASLVGVLFATAWWTLRRRKPSARAWGLAAALVNLLFSVLLLRWLPVHAFNTLWIFPMAGVVGMVVFAFRIDPADPAGEARLPPPIPGDGTSRILDGVAKILAFVLGVAGIVWWLRWADRMQVPRASGLVLYAQIVLILLAVTLVHECGHAALGWGMGMKLRAFVVGPFAWRCRGGKWEFRFDLKAAFSTGGATGMVPASAQPDRSRDISMIAGGPLINLVTAMLAFGLAIPGANEDPTLAQGVFALFGVFSLLAFVMNLIPQRTRTCYSDGAQLYQLLAGGPWADMHRASSVVASSLVTQVRPRDYDLATIERAANGIGQGIRGMLLWLHAYNHFLDRELLSEAEAALTRAESIYDQVAAEVNAELHTVFVFGNALLRRDAVAARRWWERLEASKPTRFNADYWMAQSALHWAENRPEAACESWSKGHVLAMQLPKAGAYEFDRHCFDLLRKAIDESLAKA